MGFFDEDYRRLAKDTSESTFKKFSKTSKLNELAQTIDKFNELAQTIDKFTANKVAQFVARLSGILLILGVIGSIIIAVTPTETREVGLFSWSDDVVVKDWTTSLTMGLVGLLLNSLVMLSIMMVALYIQERTSTTEE